MSRNKMKDDHKQPSEEKRDLLEDKSTEETAVSEAQLPAADTAEPEKSSDAPVCPVAEPEPEAGDCEERPEAEEEIPEEKKARKRKRKRRKDMTPEERKIRRIKDWLITGSVFGVVLLFFAIVCLTSLVGYKANFKKIAGIAKVDYGGSQLTPDLDPETGMPVVDPETGYYTFTTDRDFRILQLTDVHIGAGAFSAKKDSWAIDAVTELVTRTKPDLVIITGDIAYPVPFQAGTFNNKREAQMMAEIMENLGVYWTLTFGNHDTEAYSLYDREEIGDFYMRDEWKYCLFDKGPDDIDGTGNSMIIVKNSAGAIVQSLVTIDSHSYTDGDYFGFAWKYDKIHDNQVDWYASEIQRLNKINEDKGFGKVKNLTFFHIPLVEYVDAWEEYRNAGRTDTENVKFKYGIAGEKDEKSYPGKERSGLFDAMKANNGQGAFCGHDHLNNFSVNYKGVQLTYGLSIDYLAYMGIWKQTDQRGGTIITVHPDGSFDNAQELLVK